ncbi:MAG: hypothetical protein ACRCYY_19875 [Trueperaceae bacterium]
MAEKKLQKQSIVIWVHRDNNKGNYKFDENNKQSVITEHGIVRFDMVAYPSVEAIAAVLVSYLSIGSISHISVMSDDKFLFGFYELILAAMKRADFRFDAITCTYTGKHSKVVIVLEKS